MELWRVDSKAEAHNLALNAIRQKYNELVVIRVSATLIEREVIQRSYERGDTEHCKGRLS